MTKCQLHKVKPTQRKTSERKQGTTRAGRTSAVTVALEVGVQGEPPLSPYLLPTKQNETMRAMVSVGVLPTPGVVPAQSRYDES